MGKIFQILEMFRVKLSILASGFLSFLLPPPTTERFSKEIEAQKGRFSKLDVWIESL
jgi:hypothetical protein